jgi:hypothetical protein
MQNQEIENLGGRKTILIDYIIIFLIIIILLSFFQGYQCKFVGPTFCEINIIKNLFSENGLIENLQSLFLAISILSLIYVVKNFNNNKLIKVFIVIKVVALTYYLGEEISWGQHIFQWDTPKIFSEINNQNETNLHNISNLLDQLPRTMVVLWCGIIPIIFFYIKKNFSFKKEFNLILLPEKKLLIISIIFLILFLPDFFVDKLDLHPGHYVINPGHFGVDNPTTPILEANFFDLITFNFVPKLSELHELIFCFYFLVYSISFSKKNFYNF